MRIKLLAAFLILASLRASGQDSTRPYLFMVDQVKELSLLTSFNVGRFSFAELGIAWNRYGRIGPHPNGVAPYISGEIKLGDELLVGPKVGVHMMGGFAFGVCFIYYTDFDNGSFVLRPDIGIGISRFKMAYGYNWQLSNKDFDKVSSHLFMVVYLLKLKKIKEIKK